LCTNLVSFFFSLFRCHRYIVAVVFDDDLETMARLAEEEGVAGTGKHLWIFTDSAQSFHAVQDDKARKTLDGNDYNSICLHIHVLVLLFHVRG